mgnify:CR=1 FL=1
MAELTISERVQQAVANGYDLIARLAEAKEAIQAAKEAEELLGDKPATEHAEPAGAVGAGAKGISLLFRHYASFGSGLIAAAPALVRNCRIRSGSFRPRSASTPEETSTPAKPGRCRTA